MSYEKKQKSFGSFLQKRTLTSFGVGHVSYRLFLLKCNGGIPSPDTIDIADLPGSATDVQVFFGIGRSPDLKQVHYNESGTVLKAIDDSNPDCNTRHLIFIKPQVFMFAPEEVENYGTSVVNWIDTGKAALVCLGRSPWLASFNPYHLKEYLHFRVMFYDDFLDVICQEVTVHPGVYMESHAA